MFNIRRFFVLGSLISFFFVHSLFAAPIYEQLWSNLLKNNTDTHIRDRMTCMLVDYNSLKGSETLKTILRFLSKFDHRSLPTKEDHISFWINVYNIAAVQHITMYYPIDTIQELSSDDSSYWNLKLISVYNKKYSLNDIKEKLLLYGDERVVFALVDGSLSSPQLLQEAYTSLKIEDQLTHSVSSFINERFRGVNIKHETKYIYISTLFKVNPDIFSSEEKIRQFIALSLHESFENYRLFYLRQNDKINDFR